MTDAEREALIRQWVDTRPAGADAYRALLRLLDEARANIAPPQAPPASAMERAERFRKEELDPWLRDYSITPVAEYEKRFDEMFARAIEQAEREAIQSAERQIEALDDAWGKVCERREREARAAERERCLHWAAGSAHTAEYVVNAIESGAPPVGGP